MNNDYPLPPGSYAPFQSMSVRESFLTIDEGTAAAPGPAHYSFPINLSSIKGGSSLNNKVRMLIHTLLGWFIFWKHDPFFNLELWCEVMHYTFAYHQ